jgi:hypothetical protein
MPTCMPNQSLVYVICRISLQVTLYKVLADSHMNWLLYEVIYVQIV